MTAIAQPSGGGTWRDLRTQVRHQMAHVERAAWRRFWLALFGLGMAYFPALHSTALIQIREFGVGQAPFTGVER